MSKITEIKQQVRRQDRYSIFIDGKYTFSLSENELMQSGIKINKSYSPSELEQLKQTAVLDKAYMRSLDLIMRRQRSEWEVRDYLKRKDYDLDTIEKTVDRLKKASYVDDAKFAESWIRNRRLLKSTSKRKLFTELKQKRVDESVINSALEEDETDEIQILRELVEKKRQQSRYQDDQKLIAFLLRQGFNYEQIKEVLFSNF